MEDLPSRVPHTLFPDLVAAFVPPNTPRGSVLELVITIDSQELPLREFADYLALIDRIYGRMSREGLRSYAHRAWGRLEIAEVRSGSTEITFRFIYDHITDAATVIVILFFLKGLPNMLKITSEGIRHLAEAYKSYEEGRFTRENRLHMEAARSEDNRLARDSRGDTGKIIPLEPALQQMDETRKGQLATLLNALFREELPRLPAPIRFARRKVRDVVLRIKVKYPFS